MHLSEEHILGWVASLKWHNSGLHTVHVYVHSNPLTLYTSLSIKIVIYKHFQGGYKYSWIHVRFRHLTPVNMEDYCNSINVIERKATGLVQISLNEVKNTDSLSLVDNSASSRRRCDASVSTCSLKNVLNMCQNDKDY